MPEGLLTCNPGIGRARLQNEMRGWPDSSFPPVSPSAYPFWEAMLTMTGTLVGGLGLLLIGMGLMTDGLRIAAGNKLRDILALWTHTRWRGLFSGILITGIVQSSSAVTVATIGFANAGMLSLKRAMWVIFGSNVGTTMTAWIVALVGFRLNIESLALPLVGVGALIKLTGDKKPRASLGLALVGFGLLFMGIGALKEAFETLGDKVTVPAIDSLTLLHVLAYVGIGLLLTTLMQSSSAAIVVALSAAESGMLPIHAAAAVVIGANLGTTSTALLSVIGATSTARRVALGHVCFNVITAIAAVVLLSQMLWLSDVIQRMVEGRSSPAVSLAIFHSTFNILGVLLMWPLSGRLVRFLKKRFQTAEETESRPRHLDKNVLALPYIALDALTLELSRVANLSIHLLQQSLAQGGTREKVDEKAAIVRNLARETGKFATALNKTELTPFISEAVLSLMHSTQEYLLTTEICEDLSALEGIMHRYSESGFREELHAFLGAVDRHLDSLTPDNAAEDINSPGSYQAVETSYDALKNAILVRTSFGSLKVSEMDNLLQFANQVKRGCRHLWKAARRLNAVRESLQRNPEGEVVDSDTSDTRNIEKLQDAEKAVNSGETEKPAAVEEAGDDEVEPSST